jgi:hypothetical protein
MNQERIPGSERRKKSMEKKASAEKAVREIPSKAVPSGSGF